MTQCPVFNEDLYSDAVIREPWQYYEHMRELGPVVYLPLLGNYALPRHREVQRALRDHETFKSGSGVASDKFGCDFLQGNTVASDGQRHKSLRQAMAQPMLPGELGCIKDHIQNAADELIDRLLKRGSFDAVEDLAYYLPLTVVRELVGLPEFGREKMLQWAAAAFDVLGIQNPRGEAALPVIAEMREFITRDATRSNLKKGSWTHRIHELVDDDLLDAELAPFAIRDYINPSLDTTISATAEMIRQLAQNPDQWELLKNNPHYINNAVNESVRLSTPIRIFTRQTTKEVVIDSYTIPEGARVMMMFASANRDERHFAEPDRFDITRTVKDHVGFGSGVHMCVGMHLAQLEMEAILKAMMPRVGEITIGTPEVKLNNTICAYKALPCSFKPETRSIEIAVHASKEETPEQRIQGIVTEKRTVAEGVACFNIRPEGGERFIEATPGSHVDVFMAQGLVRQYSLTGLIEPESCTIAVLKTVDSRGGSQWMHEQVEVGSCLTLSKPKNFFPLVEGDGKVLLFAGGIGITPLLAMAWQCHQERREFELHVSVRSIEKMPFVDEHKDWPFLDSLTIHEDDNPSESTATAISSRLVDVASNTDVYICGPAGFMKWVSQQVQEAGVLKTNIYTEHFGAEIDPNGDPFTLVAKKSGLTLQVPIDRSPLEVLRDAGISVETSCEQGVCGSCLTTVLEGIPDHRDMVQTENEKLRNDRIALCCSRSLSEVLVIDV